MKNVLPIFVALLLGFGVSACVYYPDAGVQPAALPWHGPVPETEMEVFNQFISGRPTPEQFHTQYPEVQLILPGDSATKELRLDNSRYFAQMNQDGRIVGGKFM